MDNIISPEKLADYIINYANQKDWYINATPLHDIVYYVYEFFILEEGYLLIEEPFIATIDGPRLKSLSKRYKDSGIIPLKAEEPEIDLTSYERETINTIIEDVLAAKVWQKRKNSTYSRNSAWSNVYNLGSGINKEITPEDIINASKSEIDYK